MEHEAERTAKWPLARFHSYKKQNRSEAANCFRVPDGAMAGPFSSSSGSGCDFATLYDL